jgi:hypothetical protein
VTGRIASFKVEKTASFSDPFHLLSAPTADVGRLRALNGLNPLLLNGDASELGRSFDPHRGGTSGSPQKHRRPSASGLRRAARSFILDGLY